ncbi:putative apyrase 7 [Cinnamomum micranthum f. kanehirae]|uniref:Putative apyrase 7 n=1 Tax=Cinnamomum micranthum f. kanehirae TaxID=337451 RepID=A0A443N3C5_9MAGN|nr:putative apyrase 7 [Cinnamomum micranthum f. kanehirae]
MEFRVPAFIRLLFTASRLTRNYMKISIIITVNMVIVIGLYYVFRPDKAHTTSSFFTVVLDSGSTGTRVDVYEWSRNIRSIHNLPIMLHSLPDNSTRSPLRHDACHYHCMQTEPGLDKFVHNFSGISTALEPLLQWAELQIPPQRHKETPVFLLATAGLRRLPSEDADWIIENAMDVLRRHQFMYRRSWVRVLSGKEEAYYGWVALNYKLGRLGNSLEVPTLGVLDLGGSSLQVVIETGGSRDSQHFIQSKIGSAAHQLLAYSLPAFGLNAAFDRSIVMLWKDQLAKDSFNGMVELGHPCLSSGFTQNYTCYGCWLNDINLQNVSVEQSKQSLQFYLIGDPDWERCKLLARAATVHPNNSDWLQLSADLDCNSQSSLPNSTDLLNLTARRPAIHFHALSGFFAVYNMLKINPEESTAEFMLRGQQLCSRSWEDIKRNYITRNYMEQSCFRVPYLLSLLQDGFCLNDSEITFGPGDISWTLGAALVEGEYLWSTKAESPTGSFILRKMKVIPCLLFLFALSLWCVAIRYCWKIKRSIALSMPISGRRGPAIGASFPSSLHPKRQLN